MKISGTAQEAFTTALHKWPSDGLPPNPGGWITTTARNHAIDRLRRETRGRELLGEAAALSPGAEISAAPGDPVAVEDDRLGLSALADPLRRGVIIELARGNGLDISGERACDSFALPVAKSTRTYHWRILREAGLSRVTRPDRQPDAMKELR